MTDHEIFLTCFVTFAASVAASIGISLSCRKTCQYQSRLSYPEPIETIKAYETHVAHLTPEQVAKREEVMRRYWSGEGKT